MKKANRARLKLWLKKRISFRRHMSLVMLSTVVLGIVSNNLLLNLFDVTHPFFRYPITVCLSYGWFLLFIRYYIRSILVRSVGDGVSDTIEELADAYAESEVELSGGADIAIDGTPSSNFSGDLLDVGGDDEGAIVVVLVGAAFIALVFGSGAYFVWHSPEILSECLLQVILVSRIRNRLRRFSDGEWVTHILKATILPFVLIFLMSFVLGVSIRGACPEANSVIEFKEQCWKGF